MFCEHQHIAALVHFGCEHCFSMKTCPFDDEVLFSVSLGPLAQVCCDVAAVEVMCHSIVAT